VSNALAVWSILGVLLNSVIVFSPALNRSGP